MKLDRACIVKIINESLLDGLISLAVEEEG